MSRAPSGLSPQGPGRRPEGARGEKRDKGRDIRDPDPDRRGPLGSVPDAQALRVNEAGPWAFVLVYLTGLSCSHSGEPGLPVDILDPGCEVLVFSWRHGLWVERAGGAVCQPSLLSDSQEAHAHVPAEGRTAYIICLTLLMMCAGVPAQVYFGSLLTRLDFWGQLHG